MTEFLANLISGIAFASSMWAGVYLCIHDFPTLGGWICILSICGTWGFERTNLGTKKAPPPGGDGA